MKAIKEFLRPNWLRVVLFIVLSVFFLLSERDVVIGELIIPAKGSPLPIEVGFSSWIQGNPTLIYYLIIDLIFWYFLVCFIYFIITKIKRLITKPH